MSHCEKNLMLSAYYDGRLLPWQCGALEAHIATCPDCAEELAALRAMTASLREIAVPSASPEFVRSLVALSGRMPDVTVWRFASRLTGMAAAILLTCMCRLALFDASTPRTPADLTAEERPIVDPEYAAASVANSSSNSEIAIASSDVPVELTTLETPGGRP